MSLNFLISSFDVMFLRSASLSESIKRRFSCCALYLSSSALLIQSTKLVSLPLHANRDSSASNLSLSTVLLYKSASFLASCNRVLFFSSMVFNVVLKFSVSSFLCFNSSSLVLYFPLK
uniref:Uncharacterized protein n=1 Tax=Cucumis sativus TaxID=3659 RepID=A0A0A0KUI7_CUCSA